MINLVIADDHQIFREGLARLIADDPRFQLVGEAGNGSKALALIQQLKPHVAMLDLTMPKPDGIEVVEQVRALVPETLCLLLTIKEDIATVRRALDAGASGYLLKEASFRDIGDAIVKVASGKLYLGPFQDHPQLFVRPGSSQLTEREVEVLRFVAKGLTSRRIAEELKVTYRTVQKHRENIISKLGVRSTVALANYAREQGLT